MSSVRNGSIAWNTPSYVYGIFKQPELASGTDGSGSFGALWLEYGQGRSASWIFTERRGEMDAACAS